MKALCARERERERKQEQSERNDAKVYPILFLTPSIKRQEEVKIK